MAKKTIEMWGLRFSQMCLAVHVKDNDEFTKDCEKLSEDLWEFEDNPTIMEAERKELGYCYLLFRKKENAEAFYDKHKDEKMYKQAHLRLILEPAYVPSEMIVSREERGNYA